MRPVLDRVAGMLMPDWMEGRPSLRVARTSGAIRLAAVGAAMAMSWDLPGVTPHRRLAVAVVVGVAYLPLALFLLLAARRATGPAVRLTTVAADLVVGFAFSLFLPSVRLVAMLGFMVMVAMYGYLGGLRAGLALGAVASALIVLAEVLVPGPLTAFHLVFYCLLMTGMAWTVDSSGREQRRAAHRLDQLHSALRAVSSSPDTGRMVDAIATSAREALGAKFAAILLAEDLQPAAVKGDVAMGDESEKLELRRRAMRSPEHSPSGTALTTGTTVVVQDLGSDERFAEWAPVAARFGAVCMVAAPMLVEGEAIGVLNLYFDRVAAVDDDGAELATTFARQAAVVVARSLAFDREREAAERLRELDRLQAEFLATVSHELRTPLTSIKGFAHTALTKWDLLEDDLREEMLGRILSNADSLHQQIEQLLDFSKLEAGAYRVQPRSLPLREAVEECVETHRPLFAERVMVDVPQGLHVTGDPAGLERILSNLLSNAVKFAPDRSPIVVSAMPDDGQVVVSVRDAGPGIPAEERNRVFEAFYRGRDARERRGTGIGLAVVRRYVELHGGRIWVERAPEGGAAFSFTVPRSPATPDQTPRPAQASA